MKTIVIFFLSVCILTLSCKRDYENEPYTNHFSVQGKLFNDQTGNIIAGQEIGFYISPYGSYPKTMTTDQNGVFHGAWEETHRNGSYIGPGWGTPCYLYTCIDALAALLEFNYGDLKDNVVLNLDIHAKPVGYLALTLSDTSLSPTYTSLIYNHIAGYQTYYLHYDAQHNAYADTIFILKVYGDTFFPFWNDTVYIPSHDTVHRTEYF
jgi:hypothetical protein